MLAVVDGGGVVAFDFGGVVTFDAGGGVVVFDAGGGVVAFDRGAGGHVSLIGGGCVTPGAGTPGLYGTGL